MATVHSAVLCDFAQARQSLLFLVSGGLTRAYRSEVPAPIGMMLALMVEVGPTEHDVIHEITVVIKQNDTAEDTVRMVAGVQVGGDSRPGESLYVPYVVDLRSLPAPAFGSYDVCTQADGNIGPRLTFYVLPMPTV